MGEAEAQVEDEQLQKESGEAELSQDQIDAATRELMEASEEPIGKPLRAQFTSLPRVASMIDLQGERDKSRVGSLRVKSMKPSSSRHNIPTAPPVREKPARPSVQGMFPSGFNPLAGLASLNKTGGAKSGNGDNSVSAPRLSGGFQMPKFDPSAVLKGLEPTKKKKEADAGESEEGESQEKASGSSSSHKLPSFNPAAALKGLKSVTGNKEGSLHWVDLILQ